jgi:tRNA A58 N-methylase Trm61
MDIFEYGSGYSTLFYSQLVKHVVSVEYDKEWYEKIREMAGRNVQLIYQAMEYDGEYCRLINQQNRKFDVIVVDGRDRVRCAINSCRSLSENGVIIFDDSMREKYSDGIKFLLDNGFRKIDFVGLKPASKELGPAQTSIFYRPGNCLGI